MNLSIIRQIAIAADDLDQSQRFYHDQLGAKFIARFDPPGLIFFDFSGTRLLIERGAPRSTLYFWVDDIDAAYTELHRAGVPFDSEPHRIFADAAGAFGRKGEEEWMAFFKDPAGNTLALASRKRSP